MRIIDFLLWGASLFWCVQSIYSIWWWASRRSTSPSCRCGVHLVLFLYPPHPNPHPEREIDSINQFRSLEFSRFSTRDSQNFEWKIENEAAAARTAEGCSERKKGLEMKRIYSPRSTWRSIQSTNGRLFSTVLIKFKLEDENSLRQHGSSQWNSLLNWLETEISSHNINNLREKSIENEQIIDENMKVSSDLHQTSSK